MTMGTPASRRKYRFNKAQTTDGTRATNKSVGPETRKCKRESNHLCCACAIGGGGGEGRAVRSLKLYKCVPPHTLGTS